MKKFPYIKIICAGVFLSANSLFGLFHNHYLVFNLSSEDTSETNSVILERLPQLELKKFPKVEERKMAVSLHKEAKEETFIDSDKLSFGGSESESSMFSSGSDDLLFSDYKINGQ